MKIVFISAALLVSSASIAATPINGWYSSLFGGYAYLPENVSVSTQGLALNSPSYKSGYHLGGRLGFKSTPLRYEAEVTYIDSDIEEFYLNNLKATGSRGDTWATTAMANVYYDFPEVVTAIEPFVGVGIGYAWVDSTLSSQGPFGLVRYHGEDSVFAYQASAGLTYNFSENYALAIGYRYLGTDRVHQLGKMFQANLATLSITYRFNENNYK